MSVLSCARYKCPHIMCDRYSHKYGYICDECFDELVQSLTPIEEFMETEKGIKKPNMFQYYDICNAEFSKPSEKL